MKNHGRLAIAWRVAGCMMASVLAGVAEFERDLLRERVRSWPPLQ